MTELAARRRTGTVAGGGPVPVRALLLVPGAVALLVGLDAGLMLLGSPAPVEPNRWPDVHGVLLVLGFVGTLVALERAVALGRRWGHAAPALLGLGGLLLVAPAPLVLGRAALAGGCAALVALYVPLWRRQRDEAVLVQALGAVLALGASVLWLGGATIPAVLPWLVGFAVLTIGGERLELARLAMGPRAGETLVLLGAAVALGVVAALLWPGAGAPLLGLALLALTGWLGTHDVARRTVHTSGLQRYAAGCMLAAYAWLVVAGGTWLLAGPVTDGHAYDAVVHAVFLGFVLTMVMAHAPVILPVVLRRPLPYHPLLAAPVLLLHGSLAMRLWLGDARGDHDVWVWSGVLNVVAVLSFVVVAAWSAATARDGSRS